MIKPIIPLNLWALGMLRFILFFSISLSGFLLKSQTTPEEVYDTAVKLPPKHLHISDFYKKNEFQIKKDSSMLGVQQYDDVKKNNLPIQNLGDVSTPYLPLKLQVEHRDGFIPSNQPYQQLFFTNNNAILYNAKMPFTEFRYAQGSASAGRNGMIDLHAFHTQNISKQFNISAKYHSTSNVGFYRRQRYSVKNTQLTSYYNSKNHRFTSTFIYSWNKAIMQENGGLERSSLNDSTFRETPFNIRQLPTELSLANSQHKLREIEFNQIYWISIGDDSMNNKKIGLKYRLSHLRHQYFYSDDAKDFGFYDQTYYFNGIESQDSTNSQQLSNEFSIVIPGKNALIAGIKHDNINYWQSANRINYHQLRTQNLSLFLNSSLSFYKPIKSSILAHYYLSGFNQNDYRIESKNTFEIPQSPLWQLTGNLFVNSRRPHYQMEYQLSNHYRWSNNWNPTQQKIVQFKLERKSKIKSVNKVYNYTMPLNNFYIDVHYGIIDNFMYLNNEGKPMQGAKGQNLFQAEVMKHFNLRNWQLRQTLLFQQFSANLSQTALLPELVSKSTLYYQRFAFKKSTFIQIGADVSWTSSYQANTYNPALQSFQNSPYQVGAYPFVDLFLNAEIKHVRFFAVMEHVNQLAETLQAEGNYNYQYQFANYYYTTPFYASAPRRFRIGFNWKFYY